MATMTATRTGSKSKSRKGGVNDEKYRKRRKQTKEQRLRQAMILFGVTMVVLAYTCWTLFEIPERSGGDVFGSVTRVTPSLRKHLKQQQRQDRTEFVDKQEEEEEESPGILGGVGNLFKPDKRMQELEQLLADLDESVRTNKNNGIRWVRPELLPSLDPNKEKPLLKLKLNAHTHRKTRMFSNNPDRIFAAKRIHQKPMSWESENTPSEGSLSVDFTRHSYTYPEKLMTPPETLGNYPRLTAMKEIMGNWPQDDIDHPPAPFKETLIHFDFNDAADLEAAREFRDARLPFKMINVPEVVQAGETWTDDYVTEQFDGTSSKHGYPPTKGNCQESSDNYFAFFSMLNWPVENMGIPPTRNNDWTYAKWAQHARYADVTGLHPHQPHFYWQAGIDREERHLDYSQWTFVSRDLPSFSSPSETFFVFEPESQKGIQCRFGERGVTAATHFDSGRNMVAMITGAKRYILSPPKQCSRLGIVTERGNSIFRHSMLNFGHLNHMENAEMPEEEREWLERAGDAMAVDTILKAGEVLFIPSHWFHYITSLQKSAQCNVRSGIDMEGDAVFGSKEDVSTKCVPY